MLRHTEVLILTIVRLFGSVGLDIAECEISGGFFYLQLLIRLLRVKQDLDERCIWLPDTQCQTVLHSIAGLLVEL